ncbi:MAG: MFS transporter, partial [Actinobacteria bacterium]|nr:MFS transporter [Actinomycetota bacterium]
RSGRRPGLRLGYILATAGSFLAVLAAVTRFFPLLPLGVMGIGAGNAANMATRYAAADLATPERRARTIGIIVWATTIGSGFGSLISLSILDPAGRRIGLPDYGGSFLTGAILFFAAMMIVHVRLRPDPLAIAGGVGKVGDPKLPFVTSMGLILAHPKARLAVFGLMISHATMVATMTLTPLHMKDGAQSSTAISMMMFLHIVGMYFFSPVVGLMTDRLGRYPMLYVASGLCIWGAVWAAVTPPEEFLGVTAGMTIVGLAWCFGIVASSGLLTESFPIEQRASIQGAGDLCMAAFGAVAGIAAGAVVAARSYRDLNLGAAGFGIALALAIVVTQVLVRRRPEPATAAV